MKHEQLAQAMTLLDDDLLEEARLAAPRKKVIPWPRWAAAPIPRLPSLSA